MWFVSVFFCIFMISEFNRVKMCDLVPVKFRRKGSQLDRNDYDIILSISSSNHAKGNIFLG